MKYTVHYASGATGYGWRKEYARLDEFEGFIDSIRREYTASVTVWDDTLREFIFWKDCLTHECRIDRLNNLFRDMRTTTREAKI